MPSSCTITERVGGFLWGAAAVLAFAGGPALADGAKFTTGEDRGVWCRVEDSGALKVQQAEGGALIGCTLNIKTKLRTHRPARRAIPCSAGHPAWFHDDGALLSCTVHGGWAAEVSPGLAVPCRGGPMVFDHRGWLNRCRLADGKGRAAPTFRDSTGARVACPWGSVVTFVGGVLAKCEPTDAGSH